jgi:hypothetical protein
MISSKGNSSTQARIELVDRFIRHFGKDCLAGLLCDREFVGKDWFASLKSSGIPLYIRNKSNAVTTNSRGQVADVWNSSQRLTSRLSAACRRSRAGDGGGMPIGA